jgi:hypothetical protein
MATIRKELEKLAQIKTEYNEGSDFLINKKQGWVDVLSLLNNLQRGDENISSTMLFSFINRIHSNLYNAKIQVKFEPNQDGEMGNVEMINKMAQFDYQEMDMETIEYDWLWDALFFARGYCETIKFNKRKKLMEPFVINPLMFNYDPFFEEVQDWRYYDKWITRSGAGIMRLLNMGVISGITSPKDMIPGMDEQVWQWKVLREQPRNVTPQGSDSNVTPALTNGTGAEGANGVYQLMEHYNYQGTDKYVFWTDRGMTKIVREEKLDLNDDFDHPLSNEEPKQKKMKTGEDGVNRKKKEEVKITNESKWPIVIREVFREPHSSAPISVSDILEDKHRAINVLLNLAYISAKDEITPIYLYKSGDVVQPNQLRQRQIGQHIEISEDGDTGTSVQPLKRNASMTNGVLQLIAQLQSQAADGVGATQIAAPGAKGKKTATGDALQQMVSDLTSSLQSKIIGRSEKEFWTMWYQRYVNNSKDGDLKSISITNSQGTKFEHLQLTEVKTEMPPKVILFSASEAQFKETVERREIAQQFPTIQQSIAPDQFRLFLKYFWFPKFETFDRETLDLVFPKTQDEIKAEAENDMIGDGILPPISESDNHEVHLYIHQRIKNNAQKWAHVIAHEKLLAQQNQQKEQAEKMQSDQQQGEEQKGASGGGSAPPGGAPAPKQKPQKAKTMVPQQAAIPNQGNMENAGRTLTNNKMTA